MNGRRLSEFASDVYSQFGEDGCIARIFDVIGIKHRVCVEFGASDGLSCSNTARLWRDEGWRALLIEPDPACFELLEGNTRLFDTICLQTFVSPQGPGSIAELLKAHDIAEVDVMSIDVDGDDWFILQHLGVRPRVIAIEFNPTVPPHLSVRQEEPGGSFGASLLAIIRLGQDLGYRFVGATYCNAFLVAEEEPFPFDDYETDPEILFSRGEYTYAVTDYAGRVALVGQMPPWSAKEPYVLPLVASAYVVPATDSAQQIRRGFESLWGPAYWLTPSGLSVEKFQQLLDDRPVLICLDLTTAAAETGDWLEAQARESGYRALRVGGVLGLIARG